MRAQGGFKGCPAHSRRAGNFRAAMARTEFPGAGFNPRTAVRAARAAQRASRDIVRNAIKSFHGDDFAAAIRSYQRALQVDPRNPYILNLKSYAEFKIGKTDDAIETLRRQIDAAKHGKD